MPNITGLLGAISNDVVAALATAGYPPLTDGAIVIGRQHIAENSSPPRIIAVPLRSTFGPRSSASASVLAAMTPYSTEAQRQILQRSIATDSITVDFHCWGSTRGTVSPTVEPDDDFDTTQALYQQVILSTHLLAAGCYHLGPGQWVDSRADAPQLVKLGRWFQFSITFDTPVLAEMLQFVPAGTVLDPTLQIQAPDGSTEEP